MPEDGQAKRVRCSAELPHRAGWALSRFRARGQTRSSEYTHRDEADPAFRRAPAAIYEPPSALLLSLLKESSLSDVTLRTALLQFMTANLYRLTDRVKCSAGHRTVSRQSG